MLAVLHVEDKWTPDKLHEAAEVYGTTSTEHPGVRYLLEQAGEVYPEQGVRVELMGPKYARYVYGPNDTDQVIKGIAGEWCRVAVQRMDVADTNLKAIGDHAETALQVVRAY